MWPRTLTSAARRELIRKKINLRPYLQELEILLKREVNPEELISLEQTRALEQAARTFIDQPKSCQEIPFNKRTSSKFSDFIHSLTELNPSSVYLWTPRSEDCGSILLPSLKSVDFGFPFSVNGAGLIIFITSDNADRLLLDFFHDSTGQERMQIETKGRHWFSVRTGLNEM
jgi:hypothetical protein